MSGWLVPPPPASPHRLEHPPTFSVIVAAHQAAHVIGNALESALSQRPAPMEVVVCDDGSTDDLERALAPFLGRITLLRQDNRGEGSAKNAAARAARSEFVVLLDADDVYLPGRLAALGELACARPDLDLLTTDSYVTINGVRRARYYEQCVDFAVSDQHLEILRANFVFGLAAARRERLLAVGGFDESLRYTADWSGWIRMVVSGSRVGLVDEPLASYTSHHSSLSANRPAMARGRVENLRAVSVAFPLDAEQRAVVDQCIADCEWSIPWEQLIYSILRRDAGSRSQAWQLLRNGERSRGERLFAAAAAISPRLMAALRGWAGSNPCGDPRTIRAAMRGAIRGDRARPRAA